MENAKKEIHCQYCGRDITDLGGLFMEKSHSVCCTRFCMKIFLENYMTNSDMYSSIVDAFRGSGKLQEEIQKGNLVHYSKLVNLDDEGKIELYLRIIDSELPEISPSKKTSFFRWKDYSYHLAYGRYMEGDKSYLKRLEKILQKKGLEGLIVREE